MSNNPSDYIYRPLGDAGADPEKEAAPVEQIGYAEGATPDGKNIVVDVDSDRCLAKMVMDVQTKSLKPFVRFGTFGANAGWLYDPFDSNLPVSAGRGAKNGLKMFEFKKVNETCFRHYLTFLRTRDKKWHSHARRSLD